MKEMSLSLITACWLLLTIVPVWGRSGLEIKFNYRVVDERGEPVPDVKMVAVFSGLVDEKDPWQGQKNFNVQGRTNRKGEWSVSGVTLNRPGVSAEKDGYYPSAINYFFIERDKATGRWKPYERKETLVLRKIVNPIPMYAWSMHLNYSVKTNEWVGFDMLLAEWMPPHGKGETEDVRFFAEQTMGVKDIERQPFNALTVRFMGDKNGVSAIDGRSVWNQSWLKLPHRAPREGYSTSEFRVAAFLTREGEARYEMSMGATNCFFRIRTKLDEKGNATEGLYGKIRGPARVDGGKMFPSACFIT